jgi:hypothetical protein
MTAQNSSATDLSGKTTHHDNIPVNDDHWMRRFSIMILLGGVGVIVCGWNISELDQDLGRKIALAGFGVAFIGTVAWLVTHLILKGSRNV